MAKRRNTPPNLSIFVKEIVKRCQGNADKLEKVVKVMSSKMKTKHLSLSDSTQLSNNGPELRRSKSERGTSGHVIFT